MSSFGYFIKESLQGFARNFSTALGSIITIFLSLLVIGVFLVGGAMLDNLITSVESAWRGFLRSASPPKTRPSRTSRAP